MERLYRVTEHSLDKEGKTESYTFEDMVFTKKAALALAKDRSLGYKQNKDFEDYFNSKIYWHTVEEVEYCQDYQRNK